MAKQTRIYGALVDGQVIGKRTTLSMFYTHAIVVEVKDNVPPPFLKMDSRRFQAVAFSQDRKNAEKTLAYQEAWHTKQDYCVRVFLAPAVLIDKAGNLVAPATAEA